MATGYEVKAYHDLRRLADAAERIAAALETGVGDHECEVTRSDLDDAIHEVTEKLDDVRRDIDNLQED